MLKEKAMIEANLHIVQQEKEASAASKEAAIYEEAVAPESMEGELKDLTPEYHMERTKDYVDTQGPYPLLSVQ